MRRNKWDIVILLVMLTWMVIHINTVILYNLLSYPFMIYKYACVFYLEKKKKITPKIITMNSIVLMLFNRRTSCVRLCDCVLENITLSSFILSFFPIKTIFIFFAFLHH